MSFDKDSPSFTSFASIITGASSASILDRIDSDLLVAAWLHFGYSTSSPLDSRPSFSKCPKYR